MNSHETLVDNSTTFQYGVKGDRETRLGFIRKVYGILTTQMVFTSAVVFVFVNLSD